jgi:hypothetical protein
VKEINEDLADLVPSMSEGVRLLEEFGFHLKDQQPQLSSVELKMEQTDVIVGEAVDAQVDGVNQKNEREGDSDAVY